MPEADEGPRYAGFVVKRLNIQIVYEAAMVKCVVPTPHTCGPLSAVALVWFRPEDGLPKPEILLRNLRDLMEELRQNPERFEGLR